MIQFPKDFLWGSATSSYQVEGNNSNVDWWVWEKKVDKVNSGLACRHYDLYSQDFDLVKNLNHNTHRLSIEWARIEPQEGVFDQAEIQHYIDVLKALRVRGIEPMVTLHHFTNPIWFAESGGWVKKSSVARFLRYIDVIVKALAPQVHYWITINEPTIYFSHSFMWGMWPPQARSNWQAKAVHDNLNDAHIEAYHLINKIYKEQALLKPAISISHHMPAIVACEDNFRNNLAVSIREWLFNFEILNKLAKSKTLDFIGINYYSRHLVHVTSWWIGNIIMETCNKNHHPTLKNALGWDICPEGLYQILMKLKRYDLPIIITENGICTSNDNQRWEFIQGHLKAIHRAMSDGVMVDGYLYWSLLDNFEWDKGFTPRFGLIDIDYTTHKRVVRESAKKFAEVCQRGTLL